MANREILINLLKDLLDKNLCVIEKRNTNEIKDLSLLSTTVTTIQKNIKSSWKKQIPQSKKTLKISHRI